MANDSYHPWNILYSENDISQKLKALDYIQKDINKVSNILYLYNYLLVTKDAKEVQIKIVQVIHETMLHALSKNQNMVFGHLFDELSHIEISVNQIEKLIHYPFPVTLLGIASMNRNGYVREAAVKALSKTQEQGEAFPYILRRLNDYVEPIRKFATKIIMHKLKNYPIVVFVQYYAGIEYLQYLKHTQDSHIYNDVCEILRNRKDKLDLLNFIDRAFAIAQSFVLTFLQEDIQTHPDYFNKLMSQNSLSLKSLMLKKFDSTHFNEQLLISLLTNRSPTIRQLALLQIKSKGVEKFLTEVEPKCYDISSRVRETARYVLSQQQPTDFRLFYLKKINEPHFQQMPGVIMGLAEMATEEDVDLLESYIHHPHKNVRALILMAAYRFKGNDFIPIVQQAILDQASNIRTLASNILVKNSSGQDDVLRHYFQVENTNVRLACLKVLASRKSYAALHDILLAELFNDRNDIFQLKHKILNWRKSIFPRIYAPLDKITYDQIKATLDKIDPQRQKYNWVDKIIDFALQK